MHYALVMSDPDRLAFGKAVALAGAREVMYA
jgi:hypothetical protein